MHDRTSVLIRHFLFASFFVLSPAYAALPHTPGVPGGVAVVRLCDQTECPSRPQAWLGEQPVLTLLEAGVWHAVVGLPLDMATGTHTLKLESGGRQVERAFDVQPKDYPEQHIVLKDKSKVDLSPKDLARANREIAQIKQLKLHWREAPDTDLDFVLPVEGRLGSRFGLRRFFNGEPRLPHAGLDVAVDSGAPVKASAQGKVLAVGDYFFNGKTVFVDHGNGLITMYCHLSRIGVKVGQDVDKGQQLGLSGKTGRASGPHLHWSVVLNGAMVDPEWFLPARAQ